MKMDKKIWCIISYVLFTSKVLCYLIIKQGMTCRVYVLFSHHFYFPHCFSLPPFGSAVLEPNLKHREDMLKKQEVK